jgi:uncharacterized protein YbjT (DUF2867 family)
MILVIGATGTIGSELVPQLLEAGKRVRAFVRDKRKVAEKQVEIAVGDLRRSAGRTGPRRLRFTAGASQPLRSDL